MLILLQYLATGYLSIVLFCMLWFVLSTIAIRKDYPSTKDFVAGLISAMIVAILWIGLVYELIHKRRP